MRDDYALPGLVLKAVIATAHLAVARSDLCRIKPKDILRRNLQTAEKAALISPGRSPAATARYLAETAFFINRMAARVPWRADCLVQALAGQRWLANNGIRSEIVIGTAKRADGSFESHAWLRHQTRIVLGGNISNYQPLLDPAGTTLPTD